jgi:preprotein translocase subunit SecG
MTVFLVLQIIIVVALVAVILVQKTSSDGFTGASSSPNSFLTGRATANLFTRATAILAAAFLLNSLALAYMASKHGKATSIIDKAYDDKKQNDASKAKPEKKVKKPVKVQIEDMEEKPEEKTITPIAEPIPEVKTTPEAETVEPKLETSEEVKEAIEKVKTKSEKIAPKAE